jgi:hypothetical protein
MNTLLLRPIGLTKNIFMEIEIHLQNLMQGYGGPVEFILLLEEIEQALLKVLEEVPVMLPRLGQAVQLLSALIDILEKFFNQA